MSFRKQLADTLEKAFIKAKEKGLMGDANLPEITIERPAKPEHGDFASSLPLKLARLTGMKPMDIAETLIQNIAVGQRCRERYRRPSPASSTSR